MVDLKDLFLDSVVYFCTRFESLTHTTIAFLNIKPLKKHLIFISKIWLGNFHITTQLFFGQNIILEIKISIFRQLQSSRISNLISIFVQKLSLKMNIYSTGSRIVLNQRNFILTYQKINIFIKIKIVIYSGQFTYLVKV